MSLTLLLVFFALALIGVPLAVSLGLAVASTLFIHDVPLSVMTQSMQSSMNSFLLVAVPLFILAGTIMTGGGIADRIFTAADSWVGRFRGGLGHVNILGSAVFGGISGSSVADVAALGPLQIRAMTQHKYPRDYAAVTTMMSSTLSSVIPPSILVIIAAASAGQSVGAALAGGVGPAVLLVGAFLGLNYYMSRRSGYGEVSQFSWRRAARSSLVGIPALGGPVVILASIFTGIVTPTEAAGLAVVYSLVVGVLIYRQLRLRDIPRMLVQSGVTTGTVLLIAMTAAAASYVFTIDGLPAKVSELLLGLSDSPVVVMLLMGLVFLIVGAVMDIIAAILILVPVLMPTAVAVGIDPIHFVVFLVAGLTIGLVTPPVGVCLFATSYVSGLKIEQIVKSARLHYVAIVAVLVLLAVFPAITLTPVDILTG
ncbi:tripartite ATP-independent transporter DctM subunit [Haloactinopolyspora alba]|uniref:Tripartite ATP-independent transporter DctM subunit n=1 Tax=Haloactinopolyspora alba TaxID=648780 RepID=A0A2P8EEZ9_9ACTN|nr:TRAP transporter large permease [Haloactinopolyspora alba]PSL08059.1 tripartite ATP-independent transporter DctM subunit [Haloactinopolyspora alba]